MPGDSGSQPRPGSGSSILPPVFTQWSDRAESARTSDEQVVPPYFPGSARDSEPAREDGVEQEPVGGVVEGLVQVGELFEPMKEARPSKPEIVDGPKDELYEDLFEFFPTDEGDLGAAGIPDDAFIFPDDPLRRNPAPATFDRIDSPGGSGAPTDDVVDLALRLEQLALRLRNEGVAALSKGVNGGDRLDSLLGTLLIGYLAGRDG